MKDTASAFWDELGRCPSAHPGAALRGALREALPDGAVLQRLASRRKGSGSLGRPRFVAIAEWRGGLVMRQAKALVPSAWLWATAREGRRSRLLDLALGAHRAPDPTLGVTKGFVLRRIEAGFRGCCQARPGSEPVACHGRRARCHPRGAPPCRAHR